MGDERPEMTEQHDLVDRIAALQEEVDQLRRAVASHAVVDQAIGVIIAVSGLRPEQGWEVLREVSQRTNTKLRVVAAQVVGWADRGTLPEPTRATLSTVLAAHHPPLGRALVRRPYRAWGPAERERSPRA
jgi:hypothetical protein